MATYGMFCRWPKDIFLSSKTLTTVQENTYIRKLNELTDGPDAFIWVFAKCIGDYSSTEKIQRLLYFFAGHCFSYSVLIFYKANYLYV